MLYCYFGNDDEKVRGAARKTVSAMRAKRPDAGFFTLSGDAWNDAAFKELLFGSGLFDAKHIVLFEDVLRHEGIRRVVLENMRELAESPNGFVFAGAVPDKKTIAAFEAHAAEVREFSKKEARDASVFRLADAFGERDRKKTWILFCDEREKGTSPEEIIGALAWKVRTVLFARLASSASEAGLAPFVYARAKKSAGKWREDELVAASGDILELFHGIHSGGGDPYDAIETFLLSV